jgi:hypothetical protein
MQARRPSRSPRLLRFAARGYVPSNPMTAAAFDVPYDQNHEVSPPGVRLIK